MSLAKFPIPIERGVIKIINPTKLARLVTIVLTVKSNGKGLLESHVYVSVIACLDLLVPRLVVKCGANSRRLIEIEGCGAATNVVDDELALGDKPEVYDTKIEGTGRGKW